MNRTILMVQLWDKVKTLLSEKLTVAQVSRILGIDRKTVRKYRDMSQEQISALVDNEVKRRLCKLEAYRDFTVNLLKEKPMLSSPQVHDRLMEHYPDFPDVSSRTVYSFVQRIRSEEDIPIEHQSLREFAHVEQRPYGKQAQVDFGEMYLENVHGGRTKIHFMLVVLSRSCYKFGYFQSYPFTAETAVYAHHLAFRHFGGVPEEVVYDQDTTFLVDENYGKYHMTSELASYVLEVGYTPSFMMARDPQSKGLVERYVQYVKYNFLRGRTYVNDEVLNDEFVGWLERTGNQNRHSVYRFIPSAEFAIERTHLKPYTTKITGPAMYSRSYIVRQDNTISYKGNTYSVPLGTYICKGTRVHVVMNEADQQIEIYEDKEYKLIARHDVVTDRKGATVIDPEHHKRQPSKAQLLAEIKLRNLMISCSDEHCTNRYLERVRNAGSRYYPKAVKGILHQLRKIESDPMVLENVIQAAQEIPILNPNELGEYIDEWSMGGEEPPANNITLPGGLTAQDVTPSQRKASDYDKYFGNNDELEF